MLDTILHACKMKIMLNGRKVSNGNSTCYFENVAYFTKKGLSRQTVLHELYHHLVYVSDLEMSERLEKKEANSFSREFFKDGNCMHERAS